MRRQLRELQFRRWPQLRSSVRRWNLQVVYGRARVQFAGPAFIGPGFALDIKDVGSFVVGAGVDFRRGFTCEIHGGGRVQIGAGTTFTSNALIQCSTSITIGERCAFGQSVLIVDGYHRYDGIDAHWLDQGYDFVPIEIGDGVGVSDKCTIQNSIGERSMIASGSVVGRPIPAWSVAAGSPARVVRYFGPEEGRPSSARPPASSS